MSAAAPAVTAAAAAFMRRALADVPAVGQAMRVTLERVGCSEAWRPAFSVEAAPRPGDRPFEVEGVRLLLPAASPLLQAGVTLDFVDDARHRGLVVIDPRPRRCHCGAHSPRR